MRRVKVGRAGRPLSNVVDVAGSSNAGVPVLSAKPVYSTKDGVDADLAAAEAAFDVIENTNNSDIGL